MPSETVESGASPGSFGRCTRRKPLAPDDVTVSVFHCWYAAVTSALSYRLGYVQRLLSRFWGNGKFAPAVAGVGPRDSEAAALPGFPPRAAGVPGCEDASLEPRPSLPGVASRGRRVRWPDGTACPGDEHAAVITSATQRPARAKRAGSSRAHPGVLVVATGPAPRLTLPRGDL